jgi:hypothetical protein
MISKRVERGKNCLGHLASSPGLDRVPRHSGWVVGQPEVGVPTISSGLFEFRSVRGARGGKG